MLATLAVTALLTQRLDRPPRELIARPGYWIQKPVTLNQLKAKHKIVLLDFWDYTCVNCIRTFSYLKEWYRRYHSMGLEIVGVHTHEFLFAEDPEKVRAAVKRYGLPYPILNDPKRENWWLYGVFGWPTHIILEPDMYHVRVFRVGEGHYDIIEKRIQQQLLKVNPNLKFPPIMAPVRDADRPGAVCYPKTPEIFTYIKGFPKNQLAFLPSEIGKTVTYAYPAQMDPGKVYLSGVWSPHKHELEAAGRGCGLKVKYEAKEVNVVMGPLSPVTVEVLLDGKPVAPSAPGEDVRLVGGRSLLKADEWRMYSVIKGGKWGRHTLELRPQGPGMQTVSISFSSDCDPVETKKARTSLHGA